MNEPAVEEASSPRWVWGVLALSAAIAVIGLGSEALQWWGDLYDDAYIYLRYAQTLQDGCFLEWNCGEGRVEGFTSPLYLSLLAIVGAFADLEVAASLLGLVTWLAGIVLLILVPGGSRQQLSAPARASVGAGLAIACASDQLLAINIMSGMEGGLVLLGLGGLTWLATRESALVDRFAPFLVMIRPEMGLATIFQPLLEGFRWKRAIPWAVAVFGGVTLVRLLLFGDILPNTFWAKSGGAAEHFQHGLKYLAGSYLRFALAFSVVLGLVSRFRPNRYLASIILGWSAYFLWSGGDFYVFARLFAFLAPVAYLVGLSSLAELVGRVSERPVVPAAAVVTIALVSTFFASVFRDSYSPGFDNVERWAASGKFVGKCFEGASIAAVPVGAISYFSRAPVHDLVGLNDRELARRGARSRGDDFVVGHEVYDAAYSLGRAPGVIFFDVSQDRPFSRSDKVLLQFLAERELLNAVITERAPYVSISPEVLPGVYQFLFVRKDVLIDAAESAPEGCF